ncbi:MAG TPA: sigma 54-interacting transcriptional regulator [Thermoanaerobaculia bacterium]|jgi:transcriptional regulator with GAF, ATPase, and Fis domain|nr:sigma 54-interacting transcriptional regulator [Thermoanaerobaculia bacterium]
MNATISGLLRVGSSEAAAGQECHYELCGEHGDRYLLLPGANRIGSLAGSNEVVLPVRGVSRHHAVLEIRSGSLTLRDLGSKNGTFHNGVRIKEARLAPGDEVRIGSNDLRLIETGPGAELAIAIDDTQIPREAGQHETDLDSGHGESGHGGPELPFPEGYVPGESPSMLALYRELQAVAGSDIPVLLLGETGAGKEHLARILHAWSSRRAAPFIAINCAAIPADLLEAEMFGIAKGVATGVQERAGRFELAHGGTLFLDEIGDMPLSLQAKLLRALEDEEVCPLGGKPIGLDVRVVSATNGVLRQRVEEGRFRADLYYRLAGAVLEVPPLRERPADISRLVECFLRSMPREARKRVRGITLRALELLVSYPWPGNVRELEHEIRRLVYVCPDGQPIDAGLLSPTIRHSAAASATASTVGGSLRLEDHLASLERRLITEALERTRGNRTRAAALLGISRNGLAIKMERLGLGSEQKSEQV